MVNFWLISLCLRILSRISASDFSFLQNLAFMTKKFSIWRSNIFRILSGPFKWLAFFSVATNVLLLAMPIHLLQVYDRVLTSGSLETLLFLTLIVVAALVIFGICEALRGILAQRLSARFATETADDLFDSRLISK